MIFGDAMFNSHRPFWSDQEISVSTVVMAAARNRPARTSRERFLMFSAIGELCCPGGRRIAVLSAEMVMSSFAPGRQPLARTEVRIVDSDKDKVPPVATAFSIRHRRRQVLR